MRRPIALAGLLVAILAATLAGQQPPAPPDRPRPDEVFRFKSGVELINVTATVSDSSGRFVPGLHKEDFQVFEDDQPVEVTYFSAERVPVSLGILIDTSGSMAGDKMREAEAALNRFTFELLDKDDEMFLYKFSNYPTLLQGWTSDRQLISRALGRLSATGGTALYDAIVEALPLAMRGKHPKKALLVISDGNDTSSRASSREVKQQLRESEVLLYAIGIDGEEQRFAPPPRSTPLPPPRVPFPVPLPFPGGGGRGRFPIRSLEPQFGGQGGGGQFGGGQRGGQGGGQWSRRRGDERVNVAALRGMTDDSGGRTEVIRTTRDLDGATAGIADELSKQYFLGYQSPGKRDSKWHSIRVEVKGAPYRVRARTGYVAN